MSEIIWDPWQASIPGPAGPDFLSDMVQSDSRFSIKFAKSIVLQSPLLRTFIDAAGATLPDPSFDLDKELQNYDPLFVQNNIAYLARSRSAQELAWRVSSAQRWQRWASEAADLSMVAQLASGIFAPENLLTLPLGVAVGAGSVRALGSAFRFGSGAVGAGRLLAGAEVLASRFVEGMASGAAETGMQAFMDLQTLPDSMRYEVVPTLLAGAAFGAAIGGAAGVVGAVGVARGGRSTSAAAMQVGSGMAAAEAAMDTAAAFKERMKEMGVAAQRRADITTDGAVPESVREFFAGIEGVESVEMISAEDAAKLDTVTLDTFTEKSRTSKLDKIKDPNKVLDYFIAEARKDIEATNRVFRAAETVAELSSNEATLADVAAEYEALGLERHEPKALIGQTEPAQATSDRLLVMTPKEVTVVTDYMTPELAPEFQSKLRKTVDGLAVAARRLLDDFGLYDLPLAVTVGNDPVVFTLGKFPGGLRGLEIKPKLVEMMDRALPRVKPEMESLSSEALSLEVELRDPLAGDIPAIGSAVLDEMVARHKPRKVERDERGLPLAFSGVGASMQSHLVGNGKIGRGFNLFIPERELLDFVAAQRAGQASPLQQKRLEDLWLTIAHEIGHAVFIKAQQALPKEIMDALISEWATARRNVHFALKTGAGSGDQALGGQLSVIGEFAFASRKPGETGPSVGLKMDSYSMGFEEWLANQFARWVSMSAQSPVLGWKDLAPSKVAEAITKIVSTIRQLFSSLVEMGQKLGLLRDSGTTPTMDRFLQGVVKRAKAGALLEEIIADQKLVLESLGQTDALKRMAELKTAEFRASNIKPFVSMAPDSIAERLRQPTWTEQVPEYGDPNFIGSPPMPPVPKKFVAPENAWAFQEQTTNEALPRDFHNRAVVLAPAEQWSLTASSTPALMELASSPLLLRSAFVFVFDSRGDRPVRVRALMKGRPPLLESVSTQKLDEIYDSTVIFEINPFAGKDLQEKIRAELIASNVKPSSRAVMNEYRRRIGEDIVSDFAVQFVSRMPRKTRVEIAKLVVTGRLMEVGRTISEKISEVGRDAAFRTMTPTQIAIAELRSRLQKLGLLLKLKPEEIDTGRVATRIYERLREGQRAIEPPAEIIIEPDPKYGEIFGPRRYTKEWEASAAELEEQRLRDERRFVQEAWKDRQARERAKKQSKAEWQDRREELTREQARMQVRAEIKAGMATARRLAEEKRQAEAAAAASAEAAVPEQPVAAQDVRPVEERAEAVPPAIQEAAETVLAPTPEVVADAPPPVAAVAEAISDAVRSHETVEPAGPLQVALDEVLKDEGVREIVAQEALAGGGSSSTLEVSTLGAGPVPEAARAVVDGVIGGDRIAALLQELVAGLKKEEPEPKEMAPAPEVVELAGKIEDLRARVDEIVARMAEDRETTLAEVRNAIEREIAKALAPVFEVEAPAPFFGDVKIVEALSPGRAALEVQEAWEAIRTVADEEGALIAPPPRSMDAGEVEQAAPAVQGEGASGAQVQAVVPEAVAEAAPEAPLAGGEPPEQPPQQPGTRPQPPPLFPPISDARLKATGKVTETLRYIRTRQLPYFLLKNNKLLSSGLQEFARLADQIAQVPGLRMQGNLTGEATYTAGAEARAARWKYNFSQAMAVHRQAYAEMVRGTGATMGQLEFRALMAAETIAPVRGKNIMPISPGDFDKMVRRELAAPDPNAPAPVKQAAEAWRKSVLEPMEEAAAANGLVLNEKHEAAYRAAVRQHEARAAEILLELEKIKAAHLAKEAPTEDMTTLLDALIVNVERIKQQLEERLRAKARPRIASYVPRRWQRSVVSANRVELREILSRHSTNVIDNELAISTIAGDSIPDRVRHLVREILLSKGVSTFDAVRAADGAMQAAAKLAATAEPEPWMIEYRSMLGKRLLRHWEPHLDTLVGIVEVSVGGLQKADKQTIKATILRAADTANDIVVNPMLPGHAKERLLENIPDAEIEKFIDPSATSSIATYVNKMGIAIGLSEATGDPSGTLAILEAAQRAAREIVDSSAPKELHAALVKELQQLVHAATDLRDMVSQTYGLPDNPDAMTVRALDAQRNWAVLAQMGSSVFSALSDAGRLVMALGARRVFSDGLKLWAANRNVFRFDKNEGAKAGAALDMTMLGWSRSLEEMRSIVGERSRVELLMAWGAEQMQALNLLAPWTEAIQRYGSTLMQSRLIELALKVDAGQASTREIEEAAAYGIGAQQARALVQEWTRAGSQRIDLPGADPFFLAATDDWLDDGLRNWFRAALKTAVDAHVAIRAGAADVPTALHTPLGRVIGLYKSFAMAATWKIVGTSLHQADQRVVSGVLAMIGIAFVVEMMKEHEHEYNSISHRLLRAVERSGVLSVVPDVSRVMDAFTGGRVNMRTAIDVLTPDALVDARPPLYERAPRGWDTPVGAVMGPAVAPWLRLIRVMATDDNKPGARAGAVRRLLWGNNVLWWSWTFDELQQGAASVMR